MSLSKKYKLFVLLGVILYLGSSCEKAIISPSNQTTAFIKYYGHVTNQTATDLKRTAYDGGFIMVGSTNSYTTDSEADIFVVKTDPLGNEEWSTTLGRLEGPGAGSLLGRHVKYDEEGTDIVVLPDGSGYAISCNRTYVEYATSTSLDGIKRQTKAVMYLLDPAGVNITPVTSNVIDDGIELRSTTEFTEKISDMKIDTINGIYSYILTGYTTEISSNKPADPNNGLFDTKDVFTIMLDATFVKQWSSGNLAYGFVGDDYGHSIQIVPDGYLMVGTVQRQYDIPNGPFLDRMVIVKMKKSTGGPLNEQEFGGETFDLEGGASVYDPITGHVTIAASVIGGDNVYPNNMLIFQVDRVTLGISNGSNFANQFYYYQPTSPSQFPPATINSYHPSSIAILPDGGFVVSTTHKKNDFEHNIALFKVNNNFELSSGWPYYFGYESNTEAFSTKEVAGPIITVTESIEQTSQQNLTGYAFTGTFTVGTNNMVGLVKLNTKGTFEPE